MMTYSDVVQELIDILGATYAPETPITEDTTPALLKLDSLELVEMVMVLDERWPEAEDAFDDIGMNSSVGDIARLIVHA